MTIKSLCTALSFASLLLMSGDRLATDSVPELLDKMPTRSEYSASGIDSLIVDEYYKDYSEHHDFIDRWIHVMTLPENLRSIVDSRSMRTIDVVENDREEVYRYFKKNPNMRLHATSIAGMRNRLIDAFERYSMISEYVESEIAIRNLPPILSFLPVQESFVSNVKSRAGAAGAWQLMKSASGDLIVNNSVDERLSIAASTPRALDYLEGLYHVFPEFKMAATGYIRGPYGIASDLEKMLGLSRKTLLFSSYSNMLNFHVSNDFRTYAKEGFIQKLRVIKPGIWASYLQQAKKAQGRENLDANSIDSIAATNAYAEYAQEIGILEMNTGNDSLSQVELPQKFMPSIFEYYSIKEDMSAVYWKYNEWLKHTKNSFASPNYAPELIAIAELFMNPKKYGLSYKRTKPILFTPIITERSEDASELFSGFDSIAVVLLNSHIRDLKYSLLSGNRVKYIRGIIPKNTRVFLPINLKLEKTSQITQNYYPAASKPREHSYR